MSGKLEQEEGKSPLVKALGESIKGKIVDKGKKKKKDTKLKKMKTIESGSEKEEEVVKEVDPCKDFLARVTFDIGTKV